MFKYHVILFNFFFSSLFFSLLVFSISSTSSTSSTSSASSTFSTLVVWLGGGINHCPPPLYCPTTKKNIFFLCMSSLRKSLKTCFLFVGSGMVIIKTWWGGGIPAKMGWCLRLEIYIDEEFSRQKLAIFPFW